MMEKFDVVVIGSGPGGYVCAIRCAQLGLKTAIVEKYSTLGGTCLNVGCIPSKALLDSSERYFSALHRHSLHGIKSKGTSLDFPVMMKRVQSVVQQNCDGIKFLMKKNKITVFHGIGQLADANTVIIQEEKGTQQLKTRNIILATGSRPSTLPAITLDKNKIITSTEALKLKNVPKNLLIIGGGVIGLELGSVYSRLGSKVQVIEYADCLIPTMDRALGKELQKVLQKEGMEFFLSHAVQKASNLGETVKLTAKNSQGEEKTFEGDMCLVAVGRRPFTDQLNLEKVGITLNERKQIPVNHHLETAVKGIFAIGDVIPGPMLAHKAEEEGVYVAEYLAGQKPHLNYHLIPSVIYTWPEVASVGSTEEELRQKKIHYKIGQFPLMASGRARASAETDGFVKILAHKETDEVLGVHMISPRAADMISEAVTAMEFKASAEDIGRICHAHPTFSESMKEAALAASDNRALHI